MFGINGFELLILMVVALVVVGPERLPSYAEQLGRWVRALRQMARTAKDRVASELGEEAADVDWASLDPRRYDPRRIVREALLEDVLPTSPPVQRMSPARRAAGATAAGATAVGAAGRPAAGRPGARDPGARTEAAHAEPSGPMAAPFDDEAT